MDMALRVAINGFGRIGRSVLRALYESGKHDRIQVVAINELAEPEAMAHLLQYDSSHGRFGWPVSYNQEHLFVATDNIRLLHLPELQLLPWRDLDVDIVLDCTGKFGTREDGEAHIAAGAKKSLVFTSSQPRCRSNCDIWRQSRGIDDGRSYCLQRFLHH